MFKSNKRKPKPLGSRRKPQAEDDEDDDTLSAGRARRSVDEGDEDDTRRSRPNSSSATPAVVSALLQSTKLRQKQRTGAATSNNLREGTDASRILADTLQDDDANSASRALMATGQNNQNHNTTQISKASRRKRPKVGFGGGIITTMTEINDTPVTTGANMYSKESLARLKAEQLKPKQPIQTPTSTVILPAVSVITNEHDPALQQMVEPSDTDDFISLVKNPLSGEEETRDYDQTILAGDEAWAYYETAVGENGQNNTANATIGSGAWIDDNPLLPIEEHINKADDEVDEDWQDQLSRRAQWGAAPIIGTNNISLSQQTEKVVPNTSKSTATSSLSQFQQHVTNSLVALHEQQAQVQDQISRRQNHLAETVQTVQHHESTVHAIGTALEFYQHWRIRLCEFITTLRSIQATFITNIRPASQAWHEDVANLTVWTGTWQDDVAQFLQESHVLDQVLGRPVAIGNNGEIVTDEFGRTVQSQQTLQREKRTTRRDRIQDQYRKRQWPKTDTLILGEHIDLNTTIDTILLRGDESDALWSENEEESLRTRHSALKEAIAVALDSVDHPHCTVLQNLFDLFQEWYDAHPDEYNQCYAALSLADLASVLITSEIILLNDPWDETSGYNEMKWTAVVHSALKHNYIDEAAVDRLVEKTAIPILKDLLDVKGINLISRRQVGSVGTFIKHMLNILPKGKRTRPMESSLRLLEMVTQFTVDALDSMAVPVTTTPTGASTALSQPMSVAQRAMYDASWGQLRRMRKIVTNLVHLWGPFMKTDSAFASAILDFVSNRFLFVLSSMGYVVGDGLRESKLDDFAAIYISIKDTTTWLEDTDLMLAAAPITAAALAYNIAEPTQ